ncbi:hypothetical protein SNK03_004809 [Fusarium graminearum]|uniref:Uncharacterized protein n=1 Tax=Gibberella zeae TaxID=5518 RepID=A0A4E9DHS8_GIBZA|nr:unnamed protein product [Fusarium graminearum]CAF3495666.1 unnamed protein product [Fusarium graminearum]CAG1976132.1 unnamed protein product [Fusarium graminearum]CAG2012621.1 unnamed protein product [Fusarium graminearum]
MSSLFGKSSGGSRFQLPALNLNFGSITDGTDIPPPPDSPVQKVPTPPQTPPPVKEAKNEAPKESAQDTYSSVTEDVGNSTPQPSVTASSNEGQKSSNASVQSPPPGHARPASQGGASYLDERKNKRASGWFRRMRSGDPLPDKRASTMYMEEPPRAPTPQKQPGPPPPMIPELTAIEKDNGSLGSDLFKNIK